MRQVVFGMLPLFACSDYGLNKGDDVGRPHAGESGTLPDSGERKDSDPPDEDTDLNEVPLDGDPVDVVLIVDGAYIYDCYHADVAHRTDELIAALFDSGANVAVSIVTYDDYAVDGEWYTAWGGVPYILEHQVSTSESSLLSTAGGLELVWGGDGPGSGFEAIAQTMKGTGYDQDCDAVLDSSTDIRPFNRASTDAFGGAVPGSASSSVPGTGTLGGVGLRADSHRVVVLIAENILRDRSLGHDLPSGTCPSAASRSDAVDAMASMNAGFLGINAYEFQEDDPSLQQQLEDVANRRGSTIDADGDGAVDDPAVMSGDWDWPSVERTVEAIFQVAGG